MSFIGQYMNLDSLTGIFALLALIVFGVLVVFFFLRDLFSRGFGRALQGLLSLRTIGMFIPFVVLNTISLSLVFVPPTQVGVKISYLNERGIADQVMPSGIEWIVPYVEFVHAYPIYDQTYTMSNKMDEGERSAPDAIQARTADGQEVLIDVSIIFAVNPDRAIPLYISWQDRYIEDLIRPLIRGVVRSEVALFEVDEVNSTRRRALESSVRALLVDTLASEGLDVKQFLIRNIGFSLQYAEAVENKQVALEDSIAATYEANRIRILAEARADERRAIAEGEADAIIIEADARAQAIRTISAAVGGEENLLVLEYIERLSPNLRAILVPGNTNLLYSLDSLIAPVRDTVPLAEATAMPVATPETTLSDIFGQENVTPQATTTIPLVETPSAGAP